MASQTYVLRWKQAVATGSLHWYVRSLTADGSYFGYVHIRTENLPENRSFAGVLPEAILKRFLGDIEVIRSSRANEPRESQAFDCLLGAGTAGTMETVTAGNRSENPASAALQTFLRLIDELEPYFMQAASIETG